MKALAYTTLVIAPGGFIILGIIFLTKAIFFLTFGSAKCRLVTVK